MISALPPLVSDCCHARLRVRGYDPGNAGATCWYVCAGCGQVCDAKAIPTNDAREGTDEQPAAR